MSLAELLRPILPRNEIFHVLNLQTIPYQSHPIVFPQDAAKENKTTSTVKIKHFIALCHNEKVIYALEVFVYFTIRDSSDSAEKLLFISKADTNGYADININFGNVTKCILQYLLSIKHEHYLMKVRPLGGISFNGESVLRKSTPVRKALEILAKRRKQQGHSSQQSYDNSAFYTSFSIPTKVNTKISLFTRAEPEYLFSNSSSNSKKHILSGEQLLKWWLKQIDEILSELFIPSTDATLRIPGEDTTFVSKYLNDRSFPNWRVGDIFCTQPTDVAVYTIPVLPDDPKGRFLNHLIEEGRIHQLRTSTFWTELQAQQEFRLGSTVSVIGISGAYIGPTFMPSTDEVIVPESRKAFRDLKSYITGEEYQNEEGAEEAFLNIRDHLNYKTNYSMINVIGTRPSTSISNDKTIDSKCKRLSPIINTLSVRKRPKV